MKIKVLNLNCWLFPQPFSCDIKRRLNLLVAFIKKENPDIVTLQEVWLNRYVDYLHKRLPDYFAFYSHSFFFNKTGLLTLTKIKPLNSEVFYFPFTKKHNFTELLCHKGYLRLTLKLSNSKLDLINTHLYASFSHASINIPPGQFEIVSKKLNKNSILCGDFNLEPVQITKLDKRIHFLSNKQITHSSNNAYFKSRLNRLGSGKDESLDHIICLSKKIKAKVQVVKTPLF